ncbi:MAG: peroxiredoxin [Abditibacteriota bacterium]|nr:peroxiredoxin [Abditibacteriota bacterium]
MLETGTKAPDFTLPDQNGKQVSLGSYAGKKVVLYFYPKDNTPGCSKQAAAYSQLAEGFAAKGAAILAVSKDSVASHKRFEEAKNLSVTLLSDPELRAIKAWDVWHEKKMAGKAYMGVVRTTYLIDENGIIVFSNDKVKAAEDAAFMLEKL